eukprot:5836586-Prymnesium_polylepis.1
MLAVLAMLAALAVCWPCYPLKRGVSGASDLFLSRGLFVCAHPPTRGYVPASPDGAPCHPACPINIIKFSSVTAVPER